MKVLGSKGVDVQAVALGGRTIPAHLRTAREIRDPNASFPAVTFAGAWRSTIRDGFARTQRTGLENTARLCRWHHYLKTFLDYTYRGGPGNWQWIPPADRDDDLSALRKLLTDVRRC